MLSRLGSAHQPALLIRKRSEIILPSICSSKRRMISNYLSIVHSTRIMISNSLTKVREARWQCQRETLKLKSVVSYSIQLVSRFFDRMSSSVEAYTISHVIRCGSPLFIIDNYLIFNQWHLSDIMSDVVCESGFVGRKGLLPTTELLENGNSIHISAEWIFEQERTSLYNLTRCISFGLEV